MMKSTPAVCVTILCVLPLKLSQAFLAPSSPPRAGSASTAAAMPAAAAAVEGRLTTATSSSLRPRCRRRPRPTTALAAEDNEATRSAENGWEGSLLELDVVEYRSGPDDDSSLELASYIGEGKLQPLLTRTESGPNLFFHDEEAQPVSLSGGSCRIVRVLDEVYFSQRIVEDRVKNPHGEEAEDCFLLEGIDPATVIRVENSQD
ncbi:unnamed protein product [Ectocarpus sp. 8 AP-2014]